jgi:hypothetical protein
MVELEASSIERINEEEAEQFCIEEGNERPPARGLSQLDLEQLDAQQKTEPFAGTEASVLKSVASFGENDVANIDRSSLTKSNKFNIIPSKAFVIKRRTM